MAQLSRLSRKRIKEATCLEDLAKWNFTRNKGTTKDFRKRLDKK